MQCVRVRGQSVAGSRGPGCCQGSELGAPWLGCGCSPRMRRVHSAAGARLLPPDPFKQGLQAHPLAHAHQPFDNLLHACRTLATFTAPRTWPRRTGRAAPRSPATWTACSSPTSTSTCAARCARVALHPERPHASAVKCWCDDGMGWIWSLAGSVDRCSIQKLVWF